MRRRYRPVHRRHDALILLRPGDRQNLREALTDLLRLGAHAAGHDDLAVFGKGGPDGLKRFRLGAVEKAAGVDDDDIGAVMTPRQLVALGPEVGKDALGIDQRLGAAKADERKAGGGLVHQRSRAARKWRTAGAMSTCAVGATSRALRLAGSPEHPKNTRRGWPGQ